MKKILIMISAVLISAVSAQAQGVGKSVEAVIKAAKALPAKTSVVKSGLLTYKTPTKLLYSVAELREVLNGKDLFNAVYNNSRISGLWMEMKDGAAVESFLNIKRADAPAWEAMMRGELLVSGTGKEFVRGVPFKADVKYKVLAYRDIYQNYFSEDALVNHLERRLIAIDKVNNLFSHVRVRYSEIRGVINTPHQSGLVVDARIPKGFKFEDINGDMPTEEILALLKNKPLSVEEAAELYNFLDKANNIGNFEKVILRRNKNMELEMFLEDSFYIREYFDKPAPWKDSILAKLAERGLIAF